MKRKIFYYRCLWIAVVLLIFGKIFSSWFVSPEIIGGDWPTYSLEFLHEQRIFPPLWSSYRGVGGAVTPVLNLETFQSFLVVPWVNWLGLPWSVVYKVGWFGLFLVLGAVSSFTLSRTILFGLKRNWVHALSVLIYGTNTYILMLVSGGQMGVALAYALFPLVLSQFITLGRGVIWENKLAMREMLTAGLLLSLEVVLDVRFVYLSAVAITIYWLFLVYRRLFETHSIEKRRILNLPLVAVSVIIPISLAILLNAFWLLPTAATASRTVSELGAIYTSSSAVPFFSFADFSHALSLLHPNWPENLFGKTYFLQPEFLIMPLLAFGSFLTISKIKDQKSNLYFTLLALLGAFLAKGANEPFGGIYIWLFERIPGFVMFRDPTKWYVLIAVSYSVLIPWAIAQFSELLSSQKLNILSRTTNYLLLAAFLVFWLFTIREATLGKLGGTFAKRNIPKEYVELANFIARQSDFFRTLWLPKQPRFSPVSDLHPAFGSEFISIASTAAGFIQQFDRPDIQGRLEELAVKYVVIPFDALGEIFLTDRRYDQSERQDWERHLDAVGWLQKVSSGSITVYETRFHKNHFWMAAGNVSDYRMLSSGRYEVSLATDAPSVLYFSEGFHPDWRARLGQVTIASTRTLSGLNSFVIPMGFTGDIQIFFYPDVYAKWGRMLSIATLVGLAIFAILLQLHDRRKSLV